MGARGRRRQPRILSAQTGRFISGDHTSLCFSFPASVYERALSSVVGHQSCPRHDVTSNSTNQCQSNAPQLESIQLYSSSTTSNNDHPIRRALELCRYQLQFPPMNISRTTAFRCLLSSSTLIKNSPQVSAKEWPQKNTAFLSACGSMPGRPDRPSLVHC